MIAIEKVKAKINSSIFFHFQRMKFSCSYRKIIFSNRPEWAEAIRFGLNKFNLDLAFIDVHEVKLNQGEIFIPLGVDQSKAAKSLIPNNPFPVANDSAIDMLDNKRSFSEFMKNSGLGEYIPLEYSSDTVKFPAYVKPDIGEDSKGVHLVRNENELRKAMSSFENGITVLFQEAIIGTKEYATHVLSDHNGIKHAITIEYYFGKPLFTKGKDSTRIIRPVANFRLDIIEKVLKLANYEGLSCVNYKIQGGTLKILEINPRFGASLGAYFFDFLRFL